MTDDPTSTRDGGTSPSAMRRPASELPDRAGSPDESLLERFLLPSRVKRLEQVLSQRTSSLTVVVDQVHNAHNISAVMRSADAFGLTGIHLVGNEFDFSRGISLGSEKWLSLEYHDTPADAIEKLRAGGYTIVITAPADDPRSQHSDKSPIPVFELPFERKLALVFGNEKRGVSPEFVEAAELRTYIPMFGFVESFNISVACAIALFCSRIRATAGADVPAADGSGEAGTPPGLRIESAARSPLLSDAERDVMRREWLRKTVKRADAILRQIDG